MEMMIADPNETLTPRQIELLALYASGKELREIATIKFLSYSAVQQCLATARERVGATNLSHLCAICIDAGVIKRNGVGFKPVQDERVVGE
jgi:DNA-binding CsgD family transcriptional regulator